jgi:hypothetical protein
LRTNSCPVVCLGAKKKKSDPDDDDPNSGTNIDWSGLSDAEALLACRAHLQRRNSLGKWTAAEERKRQRRLQQEAAREDPSSTGFFWENPSQLLSAQGSETEITHELSGDSSSPLRENDEFDADHEEEAEDEIWETIINSRSNIEQRVKLPSVTEEEGVTWEFSSPSSREDVGFAFVGDGTTTPLPSISFKNRSEAAKRMFADPVWKKEWYERRWGSDHEKDSEKKRHREEERRLRALFKENFLANPELASMSEEEVGEAIESYLTAKQKRAASRKKSLEERKSTLQRRAVELHEDDRIGSQVVLDKDSLFTPDPAKMEELRQRRAERAAKAYRRRLENAARKKTGVTSKATKEKKKRMQKKSAAARATPREALLRIESALDELGDDRRLPDSIIADVKLILKPAKLPKRKDLLRRILNDVFDLRGKCVPVMSDAKKMMFVTKCTIDDLGAFVLDNLAHHRSEDT